jgi:hypothetical protein
MKDNEILEEIRRIRDEHARECNYDVQILFDQIRAETEQLKKEGWNVLPPPPEPRKP